MPKFCLQWILSFLYKTAYHVDVNRIQFLSTWQLAEKNSVENYRWEILYLILTRSTGLFTTSRTTGGFFSSNFRSFFLKPSSLISTSRSLLFVNQGFNCRSFARSGIISKNQGYRCNKYFSISKKSKPEL